MTKLGKGINLFEKEESWEEIVQKMKEQNRFPKFCPKCKEKRFMLFFGHEDEIANWYCFGCKTYFTDEMLKKL